MQCIGSRPIIKCKPQQPTLCFVRDTVFPHSWTGKCSHTNLNMDAVRVGINHLRKAGHGSRTLTGVLLFHLRTILRIRNVCVSEYLCGIISWFRECNKLKRIFNYYPH